MNAIYRVDATLQVRVTSAQFLALAWEHKFSEIDSAVLKDAPANAVFAGFTEWSAPFMGRNISIGWDWYSLGESFPPVLLTAVRPRSNMLMIDTKGYDQSDDVSSAMIFECLAADFWHTAVMGSFAPGLKRQTSHK